MTSAANIKVLALREMTERAKSPAFKVTTAILLISVLLAIVLPQIIGGGGGPRQVGVVGDVSPSLRTAVTGAVPEGDPAVELRSYPDRTAGDQALKDGDIAALVVDPNTIVWKRDPSPSLSAVLSSAIAQQRLAQRADELGLTDQQVATMFAPAAPTSTSLDGTTDTEDRGARIGIATIGLILLFVSMNFYGGFVLTGVVEEKANRVVEVLLARVRPWELLAGKVIGIGLLGLIQFVLLAGVALGALTFIDLPSVPSSAYPMIGAVFVWFLLGYAFYSVAYGSFGSLASRMEDAQSAVGPLTVFLLLMYFMSFGALENPEATWVTVVSFLPPAAPLLMPVRTALLPVPFWQQALAVVIMLAGIYGFVRLGGRLYRNAVLRTGGKLSIKDAWRGAAAS